MSNKITQVFTDIYNDNFWDDNDSVSGPGSNLEQTEAIRQEIPKLLSTYSIQSVLDIPCGDYFWWNKMELPPLTYIGADIVPEIVSTNSTRHPTIDFRVLDIITDDLPTVDLIFCRDCLVHFSVYNICRALNNIKASGSTYLLATHFSDPKRIPVPDIKDGAWRPLNLSADIFVLGKPISTIDEKLLKKDGEFRDKCLALWRIN